MMLQSLGGYTYIVNTGLNIKDNCMTEWCITRNMFCGMWYLPHSQVHNDRNVTIITVILHISHCAWAKKPYFCFWHHHHVPTPHQFPLICENFDNSAINEGYVAYLSLRMHDTPYFYFRSKIWCHHCVSWLWFPYNTRKFRRFTYI